MTYAREVLVAVFALWLAGSLAAQSEPLPVPAPAPPTPQAGEQPVVRRFRLVFRDGKVVQEEGEPSIVRRIDPLTVKQILRDSNRRTPRTAQRRLVLKDGDVITDEGTDGTPRLELRFLLTPAPGDDVLPRDLPELLFLTSPFVLPFETAGQRTPKALPGFPTGVPDLLERALTESEQVRYAARRTALAETAALRRQLESVERQIKDIEARLARLGASKPESGR